MKRKLYFILIIVFIAMITTSCYQLNIGTDENKSNLNDTNYEKDMYEEKTLGEKSLIFEGPLLIDNVPILSMTYDEILEHFGEPEETRIEKFRFPSASPDNYNYFAVLCYENLEILFFLLDENLNSIKPNDHIWGLELIGNKFNLGELRVGMSVNEYLDKFGDSKLYSISELKGIRSDPYIRGETGELINILSLRPDNYYSKYDYVYYEQGSYPIGFALLIQDNKINRIVIGRR